MGCLRWMLAGQVLYSRAIQALAARGAIAAGHCGEMIFISALLLCVGLRPAAGAEPSVPEPEQRVTLPLVTDPSWSLQLRGSRTSTSPPVYDVALWIVESEPSEESQQQAFDTGVTVRGVSWKKESFEYVSGAGAAVVALDRQRLRSFLQRLGTSSQLLDALDLSPVSVRAIVSNDLRDVDLQVRLALPGLSSLAAPATLHFKAATTKTGQRSLSANPPSLTSTTTAAQFLASSNGAIAAWESSVLKSDAWKQLVDMHRGVLSTASQLRREGTLQDGNLRLSITAQMLGNCAATLVLRVKGDRLVPDIPLVEASARECARAMIWGSIDQKQTLGRLDGYLQLTDVAWDPESAKFSGKLRFMPGLSPMLSGIEQNFEIVAPARSDLVAQSASILSFAKQIREVADKLLASLDALTKRAGKVLDPATLVGARYTLFGLTGTVTAARFDSESDATRLVVDLDTSGAASLRVQGIRLGGVSISNGAVQASGVDLSRAKLDMKGKSLESGLSAMLGTFDSSVWKFSSVRLTGSALVLSVEIRLAALSLTHQAADLVIPASGLSAEELKSWARSVMSKAVGTLAARLPKIDQIGGVLKNVALVPSGDLLTKPEFTVSGDVVLYSPFTVPFAWPLAQPFDAAKHVQWVKLSPAPTGVLGKFLRFDVGGFTADCGRPKLDRPYGVFCKFQVAIPALQGLGALGGTVAVTTQGIESPDSIHGPLPFTIVTPPGFVISGKGFDVSLKGPPTIAFFADLTYGAPDVSRIAKVKGKFEANLAELIFLTTGDLVVADTLDLSHLEGKLDITKARATMHNSSSGLVKQIVDFGEEWELDAGLGIFKATGSLNVLKIRLIDAGIDVSTRTQNITIHAEGNIPFAGSVQIGAESDLLLQRFRLRADPIVNVFGFSVKSHVRAIPGKVRLTVEIADLGSASVELETPDKLDSNVIEQLVLSLKDISFTSLDLNIRVNRSKDAKMKEDDFWPSEESVASSAKTAPSGTLTQSGTAEGDKRSAAAEALKKGDELKSPRSTGVFPPSKSPAPPANSVSGSATLTQNGTPSVPAANEGNYRVATALERGICVLRFTPDAGGTPIVLRLAATISAELLETDCLGQKRAWRLAGFSDFPPHSAHLWSESDSSKLIFVGDGSDVQPIVLDREKIKAVFGDESFLNSFVDKVDGKDPLLQKGQPEHVKFLLTNLVNDKNVALLRVRRQGDLLILTIKRDVRREMHLIAANGMSYEIKGEHPEFAFLEARPEHKFYEFMSSLLKMNGEVITIGLNPKQDRIYVAGRWDCALRLQQQTGCVVWASDTTVTKPLRVSTKGVRQPANSVLRAFAASANGNLIDAELSDVWLGTDISLAARGLGDDTWAVLPARFDYQAQTLRIGPSVGGSVVEQRYSRWRTQAKVSSSSRSTLRTEEDRRWLIEQIVRGAQWDRSAFPANPTGLLLND